MDDISLALNPPRFVKIRRPPIRISERTVRVWPLASINGRAPAVLETQLGNSRGVDLAYPRVDVTDAITSCSIGTPNGTTTHLMPPMTAALAIDGGEIVFAGRLGHGFGVIINHGNGWVSHYANLQAAVAIRTDLYRPRARSTFAPVTRSGTSARRRPMRSSSSTSSFGSATPIASLFPSILVRTSRRGRSSSTTTPSRPNR